MYTQLTYSDVRASHATPSLYYTAGKNLSAPKQFRSKEISKSNVVDDMVASNGLLFDEGEKPDHVVVIKYLPYVGDSKCDKLQPHAKTLCGGLSSMLAAPLCCVTPCINNKIPNSACVSHSASGKRAMDEYTSEIFMGGKNTITMHNVCEDSLLASPLILDLVILRA